MFGIGSTELIVILVVALLVLGPKKLPEIARSLGKGMAEFRRMSTDVKRTIEMESDRSEEEKKKKEVKEELFPEKEQAKEEQAPTGKSTSPAEKADAEQDQGEKKA
jgi:sec-independent protein translocase protein TatB